MSRNPKEDLFRMIRLREALLKYFEEPNLGRNAKDIPGLEGYDKDEIAEMIRALSRAGYIVHVRGYGPGSVYETSWDGMRSLESTEGYKLA